MQLFCGLCASYSWLGTGLVVNVSSSLRGFVLLSTPLVTSSSTFSTATSLLGPWPYLPCIGQRPRRHGRCAINTMYSYAGDISHKSDKHSTSIQFLIIDTFTYIFTPLHWGFTVVTSSLSILVSLRFLSVTSIFCISAVYAILSLSNIVPYTKKENGEE